MAPFSESASVSHEHWPKWQIAVAVGATVVVGAGALYYFTRRKKSHQRTEFSSVGEHAYEAAPDAVGQGQTLLLPEAKAQAAKDKGNKLFKGGKFDKAIDCYSQAIDLCPPDRKAELATYYQNRAAALEQLRSYEKVIDDCNKAIEMNNRYTKALFRRAKACEHLNRLDQCLEDVTAVCILEDFQNPNSLLMADRVLKDLGKQRAKEAYQNRQAVMPSKQFVKSYFSAFAEDPVISTANDVQQKDSSDIENISGYAKARASLKNNDYETIIDECSKELATGDFTHRPEAFLLRATFYLLQGQGDLAMADFNDLMEINSAGNGVKANALIKRGSLKMQQGDNEGSLADFALAAEIDSDNSDVYHHRGQLYLLMDKGEQAIADFKKCVEIRGDFPIAHVQKCYTEYRYALTQQSPLQIQAAMQAFDEVLNRFPNCAEGFALYGQALYDQQELEKADEYFKKALEIEPDNANVYVHRGLLQLQWKQDIEAAAALINKALEIDDRCEFAYETLGTIEVQRGNLDKSVELFEKAISLAKTEIELSHLHSLYEAAKAQVAIGKKLSMKMPAAPLF